MSPDVGTSTNLGGWINKAGIWNVGDRIDWFADDTDTLVRWRESDHGRHIELGIAEVNLVGLLGELGATWSRDGQPLLPVGTIYDPFVSRALEPWSFGIYAGGQSILVGTPSGVTLGPEGGAHQSVITPSIGIEQPGCVAYEPAFGQDFEWCFLHALSQLGKPGGTQRLLPALHAPDRPVRSTPARARRRSPAAIASSAHEHPRVIIAVMGALVPEALQAAEILDDAEVVCITSADLLFRSHQARSGFGDGDPDTLADLFRAGRADRQPRSTATRTRSRSSARRSRCLGVQRFGQAGDILELYEHHEIDAESVVGAALDLLAANSSSSTIRAVSPWPSTRGCTGRTSCVEAHSSERVGGVEARDLLERLDRREDHQQLVGLGALERARRLEPARVDDLGPVDLHLGVLGRDGDEEVGVEADRHLRRRDPARERDERRRVGQRDPDLLVDLAHAPRRGGSSLALVATAPPGNTHAPPMKRALGVRWASSTSSRSAPPRTTRTVAACRGVVATPLSLRIVPGSGPGCGIPPA